MGHREWGGMYLGTERDQRACLTWFASFVPEEWGLPLKSDVQEEVDTGRETAIRALFRLPGGELKEAVRTKGGRTWTVRLQSASPGILRGWRPSDRTAISMGPSSPKTGSTR